MAPKKMQVTVMRLLLLLLFCLLLPNVDCQWWGGGYRRPSNPFRHSHRQPLSSYSSYGTPEPEPEPEPLPRFTRRLSPSRPSTSSHYRQLSSTSSRAKWNVVGARERSSAVKVK